MARKSNTKGRRKPIVEKRVRPHAEATSRVHADVWGRILARRLRGRLGEEVELTITDNIHTMVSYIRNRGRCRVRLHHMFLGASPRTLEALASYLAGEACGSGELDAFIESNRHLVRRVSACIRQRRLRIEPHGSQHDLTRLFADVNRRYFRGQVSATITWATVPRIRRPRRSIKLGSYSEDTGIIRIHPALDHPLVPQYVVEYIVFHEMLHVVEGAQDTGGRRVVHTPAYLRRELRYRALAQAKEWERRNIDWLLAWQPRPRRRPARR